jgi:MATE family multidrug resistance protein
MDFFHSGIPLGIFFAFALGMGLTGLWIGLTISLVYCASIGVYMNLNADWEHEVEKVGMRIAGEHNFSGDHMNEP